MLVFLLLFFALFIVSIVFFGLKYQYVLTNKDKTQEPEHENAMNLHSGKTDEQFQVALVYLAGWMLRKNAQESKAKLQFIREYLQQRFHHTKRNLGDDLVDGMRKATNIRSVANWINKYMKTPEERIGVIDFMFELAAVDGEIIDREFVAIVRFSELIGVRASYVEKKLLEYRQQRNTRFRSATEAMAGEDSRLQSALILLKLTWPCSEKEIKRAYRKQVKKVHPDHQTSVSEAEKKELEQQFIALQAAYEFLLSKAK